jgi:HD superfamily phosphohydrolase
MLVLLLSGLLSLLPVFLAGECSPKTLTLETLYGNFMITDPLLLELHAHPIMQRLKDIRHYGADYYAFAPYDYTRYGHSIGVAHIVDLAGGSREEIAAALYHDVSHPAFSHATEKLLTKITRQTCSPFDYQDAIHQTCLEHYNVAHVLKKYNLSLDDISPKKSCFKRLEQELPDLCADRIEYTLSGAFHAKLLNQEQIQQILEQLHYEHGTWFFTCQEKARIFANLSLYLTRHAWASPEAMVVDFWLCQALERALELSLITLDDIHYATDDVIWDILKRQRDITICKSLYKIEHCYDYFMLGTPDNYNFHIRGKFRGTNPLVLTANGLHRLTDLDIEFKQAYQAFKESIKAGWYIILQDA